MVGSAAIISESPKLGSTLLLLFASIQKVLIGSYGLVSITYPFLFDLDNGPLKYPYRLSKKYVP
jgi:hypothetical protein